MEPENRQDAERDAQNFRQEYWRAVLRLTLGLLIIWFSVSFGAGILFRDVLDKVSLGGAPLGFWMAQNGAIYVFVALIFYYCWAMRRIERRFGIDEGES